MSSSRSMVCVITSTGRVRRRDDVCVPRSESFILRGNLKSFLGSGMEEIRVDRQRRSSSANRRPAGPCKAEPAARMSFGTRRSGGIQRR